MNSGRYMTVELGQSCQATVIPGGQPMLLQRGEQVVVTQTLGGSVTVQTEMGYLVRINAEDSAALGLSARVDEATFADEGSFELDQVIAQLKNVFDQEFPTKVWIRGLALSCRGR